MSEIQRIDKLLSNSGYGTRKEVKQMLKQGHVKVDNSVVKDPSTHVDPLRSIIEIHGQALKYRKYLYVMLNKPAGVISATYDKRLKTVADILPEKYKSFGLFPAGRLDIDTEGLLLMTNDGQLAHDMLAPKKHVPKKYFARINNDIEVFREGVILDDGYKTLPAKLRVIDDKIPDEVEIVIYEGKYHQIKRMFEAVGKKVLYLKRIQMGSLKLDERLKTGECRELTEDEVQALKTADYNEI